MDKDRDKDITIINNYYPPDWSSDIKMLLENSILQTQKLNKIMGQLEDLQQQSVDFKTKITELQASVDLEQEQIKSLLDTNAQVVSDLTTRNTELEALLANSPDPVALQAVIDSNKETIDSIATTKADIEGTVADQP